MAILDIGCGNAAFLVELKRDHDYTNLTGADYSEKSVELAIKIKGRKN